MNIRHLFVNMLRDHRPRFPKLRSGPTSVQYLQEPEPMVRRKALLVSKSEDFVFCLTILSHVGGDKLPIDASKVSTR